MSRAANCYDNAFMESCFGTIKTELEMTEYPDQRAARREIGEYLHYYQAETQTLGPGLPDPATVRTPEPTQPQQNLTPQP